MSEQQRVMAPRYVELKTARTRSGETVSIGARATQQLDKSVVERLYYDRVLGVVVSIPRQPMDPDSKVPTHLMHPVGMFQSLQPGRVGVRGQPDAVREDEGVELPSAPVVESVLAPAPVVVPAVDEPAVDVPVVPEPSPAPVRQYGRGGRPKKSK